MNGKRKPHMLTEYDHPAPNPHAGEGPLFLAAYAAMQDFDAVYLFAYDKSDFADGGGKVEGFFDYVKPPDEDGELHPRRPDVPPRGRAAGGVGGGRGGSRRRWNLMRSSRRERCGRWWTTRIFATGGPDSGNRARLRPLLCRVATNFTEDRLEKARQSDPDFNRLTVPAILWDANTDAEFPGERSGVFGGSTTEGLVLNVAPRSDFKVGRAALDGEPAAELSIEETDDEEADDPRVAPPAGTAAIMILSGDFEPTTPGLNTALLVATGDYANTAWQWKTPAHESLGADWGTSPTLIETVSVTLSLRAEKSARAWALDAVGRRVEEVEVDVKDGTATIQVGPGHTETATLFYESRVGIRICHEPHS